MANGKDTKTKNPNLPRWATPRKGLWSTFTFHTQGKHGVASTDDVNNYARSDSLSRARTRPSPGQVCPPYMQLSSGWGSHKSFLCLGMYRLHCGTVEFSQGIVLVRESVWVENELGGFPFHSTTVCWIFFKTFFIAKHFLSKILMKNFILKQLILSLHQYITE